MEVCKHLQKKAFCTQFGAMQVFSPVFSIVSTLKPCSSGTAMSPCTKVGAGRVSGTGRSRFEVGEATFCAKKKPMR